MRTFSFNWIPVCPPPNQGLCQTHLSKLAGIKLLSFVSRSLEIRYYIWSLLETYFLKAISKKGFLNLIYHSLLHPWMSNGRSLILIDRELNVCVCVCVCVCVGVCVCSMFKHWLYVPVCTWVTLPTTVLFIFDW